MPRERKAETSGPLAGHVRQGRRYVDPIVATGVMDFDNWVRDDLPDLLWPVLVLSEAGTLAARRFVQWQDAVQHDLADQLEARFLADNLDGRLTGLDRLVERLPDAKAMIRQRAKDNDLLSEPVESALANYPQRPADWLIDREHALPSPEDLATLGTAVYEVLADGHREAVIKCLFIWSAVQAGTFSADPQMIEVLKTYPTDPSLHSLADPLVRASWAGRRGALLHDDPAAFDATIRWAKVFWGFNSMTTRCGRRREAEADQGDEATEEGAERSVGSSTPESPVPEDGAHLQQLAMDLLTSYIEALETAPFHLYDPEPQEVHSGLVSRAARDVITALGAPDLWCLEHGAHIGRSLVEVRIYLHWMSRQDRQIYERFQDYGAGKAKLYARILQEIPDGATGPELHEGIEELEDLSHNDVLDMRTVDTGDSFSGKSLRAMADECGLLDLYRYTYALSSGVAHSEWWSVETHAMERCRNPLHRGHLIPSLTLNAGNNAAFARGWVDQLYSLIRTSLQILGTDEDAVEAAFAWLNGDDDTQSETGSAPEAQSPG